MRLVSPQSVDNYKRNSDQKEVVKHVFELTDVDKKRVQVTVYTKLEERLELVAGMGLALRATVHVFRQRVALRAFYKGVETSGVPEADAIAERFRREPWTATPVEATLHVLGLPQLLDHSDGERVDVRGVATALYEARVRLEC